MAVGKLIQCVHPVLGHAPNGFEAMLQEKATAARAMLKALPRGAELMHSLRSPYFYDTEAEIHEERLRILAVLKRLGEEEFDPAPALDALARAPIAFSWLYHGETDRELLEPLGHVIATRLVPKDLLDPLPKRAPGPLRIGYISSQLRNTNASRWAQPWARACRSAGFEVVAIDVGPVQDAVTEEWARLASQLVRIEASAEQIGYEVRKLDLDCLIFTDVGIDGLSLALGAMRLARVQCAAWGGPSTSGSPNMDYFLAGELMLDELAEAEFVEKLVRLPGTGLCYEQDLLPQPLPQNPKPPFEPFAFCPQNLPKCHPRWDSLLSELNDAMGTPIAFPISHVPGLTERLARRFKRNGVNAQFFPPLPPQPYAGMLAASAVSVDTFEYNGGITAIEALALGTPILTLPLGRMRGRYGKAFMEAAGLGDFVPKTREDYLAFAKRMPEAKALLQKSTGVLIGDSRPCDALVRWIEATCPR